MAARNFDLPVDEVFCSVLRPTGFQCVRYSASRQSYCKSCKRASCAKNPLNASIRQTNYGQRDVACADATPWKTTVATTTAVTRSTTCQTFIGSSATPALQYTFPLSTNVQTTQLITAQASPCLTARRCAASLAATRSTAGDRVHAPFASESQRQGAVAPPGEYRAHARDGSAWQRNACRGECLGRRRATPAAKNAGDARRLSPASVRRELQYYGAIVVVRVNISREVCACVPPSVYHLV